MKFRVNIVDRSLAKDSYQTKIPTPHLISPQTIRQIGLSASRLEAFESFSRMTSHYSKKLDFHLWEAKEKEQMSSFNIQSSLAKISKSA